MFATYIYLLKEKNEKKVQECDHPSITASGVLQGKATQALVESNKAIESISQSESVRLVLSLLNPSCISKNDKERRTEERQRGKEEGSQ